MSAPPVVEGFRLAPQQARLWTFLDGAAERAELFRAVCRVRLEGRLDRQRLDRALAEVVARHEVLRTELVERPYLDRPLQRVLGDGGDEGDGGGALEARVEEEDDRAPELVVTLPPGLTDVPGLGHLVAELAVAYRGGSRDEPVQFIDAAEVMLELLEEEGGRDAEQWRPAGAGELPEEASEGAPGPWRPAVTERLLPSGGDALRSLAAELVLPEESLLLAVWQVVVARAEPGPFEPIAVASDGRASSGELSGALGLFERYLPVPRPESGEGTFAELARTVSAELDAARRRQDVYTFEVASVRSPGAVRRGWWWRGFAFRPKPAPVGTDELSFHLVEARAPIERMAVELVCETGPGFGAGLGLTLHHDLTRVGAWRAERLLDAVESVLDDLFARGPAVGVEELALVGRGEAIGAPARSGELPAGGKTLWELVADRAAQRPGATALELDRGAAELPLRLEYAELVARAREVADALAALGVGPEDRVGLLAERSVGQAVGLLGILAAGGAWVPLDPDSPVQRLGLALDDAGCAALVVTPDALELAARLAPELSRVVVGDAAQLQSDGRGPGRPPRRQVGADQLAYVVYTSGSTGRPKGVANRHRGIVNRVLWMIEDLGLGEDERVLWKTPASFDASIWELFVPLAAGGTVVVPRPGGEKDPAYLVEVAERLTVTVLQLVPSVLRLVLDHEPGRCRSLTHWFSGGEALPVSLARQVLDCLAPGARLINLYGPTEVSVDATFLPVHEEVDDGSGGIAPVGRPLPNVQVHVVDRLLRRLPGGSTGELVVGGVGVARCYLGRPAMTAERFVPDPFGGEPGARLYRTGDLAAWNERGELDFFGRLDHQVKIRGVRVELGEIEARLNSHPAVASAAARVWRGAQPGQERLVVYVVAATGETPEPVELAAHLTAHLPAGLSTPTVVPLDALPLTRSGKLDRQALPEPRLPDAAGRAARTPVEDALLAIWRDLLEPDDPSRLGIETDFFAAGGHSLLATLAVTRVREAFSIELPIRELFDHPTPARMAKAVEERLPHGVGSGAKPLVPRPRDEPRVLSFAQQRMWFLHRLEPDSSAYHMPMALRLTGRLSLPAVGSAFATIVWRHEVVRTVYGDAEGEPVLTVLAPWRPELPVVDLSGLGGRERSAEERRLAAWVAAWRFDLARRPPLYLLVARASEAEHLLFVSLHHIASDGWSTGVLIDELAAVYRAAVSGIDAELPSLPVQYADYAAWQRERLSGGLLERELGFWRNHLAGAPPLLALPTDRPRPAEPAHRGERVPVRFGARLARDLDRLAARQHATTFMASLALFAGLLGRLSNQETVVIGTPIANRTRAETERLIGLFANTLALATDLGGSPDFGELLGRVRESALAAYAHQEVPFERLVEELAPVRMAGVHPLFQVLFVFQNTPRRPLELPGLELAPFGAHPPSTHYDLVLVLRESPDGGGLEGSLEYDRALFDRQTGERWVGWLERLAEGAVARPDQPFDSLPMLTSEERAEILDRWSGKGVPAPPPARCEELIFQIARTAPAATALLWEDGELTYAELERWSRAVALRLRSAGVREGGRVGLIAHRGPETMAAILGAWSVGAAYVPIDPHIPAARAVVTLERAGVTAVAVTPGLDRLAEGLELPIVVLERAAIAADSGEAVAQPAPVAGPDGAAYVIFTSGSTGHPKGVVISHGNLVRFAVAHRGLIGLEPADRVFQFFSLSFDASAQQMYPTLVGGATLVLHRDPTLLGSSELMSYCERQGVTVLELPVALWRSWIDEISAGAVALPSRVRLLATGGEELSPAVQRVLGRAVPELTSLGNSYGPTEATVAAAYAPLRAAEAAHATEVLELGRPLPGVRLYVVDRRLEPVGRGLLGELLIGGTSVGRGYLGRPASTAAVFVPDPFAPDDELGARLYRTGDLVRVLGDGRLRFVGRGDHQVKVRGFRVELGEVEAALRQDPRIEEAVVDVRGDGAARRLVAFVTTAPADAGNEPTPRGLAQALAERLPDHMVPSRIVLLERIPLTTSGKVDRRALPELDEVGSEREHVAPRTPVEEALVDLWSEVLDVERIGVHDDFFELGGHSLLATRLASRLRQTFRFEVPLRLLFGATTVAELADELVLHEPVPGQVEKVARALATVRGMSSDAVREMVEARRRAVAPAGGADDE